MKKSGLALRRRKTEGTGDSADLGRERGKREREEKLQKKTGSEGGE